MKNTFRSVLVVLSSVLLPLTSSFASPPTHNQPGSSLVFPKFDIRSNRTTELRIVNSAATPVRVKLNYICPGVKHVNEFCSYLDRVVTFTPYQTRIIDVADHNPPCAQGYVTAFAVSEQDKDKTVIHPYLYGSYHLKEGRRHEANNAVPFGLGQVEVSNGVVMDLSTDFQATLAGGVLGSRLVLLDLNILPGMQNPPAVAFIDFWNSAEEPFSTSIEFICWTEVQLDEIDANFRGENLGTEYGSMKIEPRATCPVPGTCPPTPPHQPKMLGTIEQFCEGTRATRTLHSSNYVDF